MNNKKTFIFGLVGTFITLVCCFTPLLVITLGAIGLSTWIGFIDYFLIPLIVFFIGLTYFSYKKS
ncbi:mercury resistance system transport protein MerF [Chengkuizengella sediminis]|uniref:mercury resistance system transport protein MerF n=1 Tax=Chengkuizengella sediminis TaxID=1885917 RepID=UPI0013895C03|nr:mercury resistance system transport protein MerF [Chengkuizengella sediminis]